MAFNDQPEFKVSVNRLSPPPSCECGEDAKVSLLTVINRDSGELKTGGASEFVGRDHHNNPTWELQEWYDLQKWHSYCGLCYAGHIKPGNQTYTDKQVAYAWRWFLGEISGGMFSKVFKSIDLTDAQKDTAIEIVNREAHRVGLPDAIPDEYKLMDVWAQ